MSDSKEKSPPKSRFWLRLAALIAREPQDKEQLREVLRHAEDRHLLSPEILTMVERVLQVSEMQVREVMIPKSQMVVIRKKDKLDEILAIVVESGHSRFPVMDAQGKEVVGMLLAKDLLKEKFKHQDTNFNITSILRPAIFTPHNKRLDILLREFRVNRNHIAIVLDEYGHVTGLVTIEDVLEQIVGDIEDEYDIDEEDGHIKKIDEDTYIIKSSTKIEEFNEYFQGDVSNTEFDTIGGVILNACGHMPKRGEQIKINRFRFKVLHSDNKRIYLLEMKIVKSKKKEE